MQNINIIPRMIKVKIFRVQNEYNPYVTLIPDYHYEGIATYKWLWFTFTRKYKKFEVWGDEIEFKKTPKNSFIIDFIK